MNIYYLILVYVVISSIMFGIFNLFQLYGLIYVFFLIHGTKDIQIKKKKFIFQTI